MSLGHLRVDQGNPRKGCPPRVPLDKTLDYRHVKSGGQRSKLSASEVDLEPCASRMVTEGARP